MGYAHRFRPTYALANMGHPSIASDVIVAIYRVPGGASNLVTFQMFLQYSWIARSEENLPMRAAL